jgi:FixJ family two-component response regulator
VSVANAPGRGAQIPANPEAANALARSRASLERGLRKLHLQTLFESLSLRERQVMTLVVEGLTNKQVDNALDISEPTVKAHRGRVMEKMQAATFVELVDMAAELGIRSRA